MQDRKRETADALQNVGGDSSRKRRAITHTFIIIALSGTVCKGKKSSAKRVFTGSYGILTNRPYWWLRSPRASSSYRFVFVNTDGTVNYYYASYSLGFAPGFCV